MPTSKDYNTKYKPTWCPGCGDFGILTAVKIALSELNIPSHDVVTTWDVGCIGNGASTLKSYSCHALHGRALPVALGAKLANPKLTVIAFVGDGGMYGEGTNHLLHAARYNVDVNLIVADNKSFSLTTGQSSPTSDKGYVTKTTPFGEIKKPVNPLGLSLIAGSSFVARGAAYDIKQLTELIKQAIQHKGFSHLDVLQQCVTFNKINTVDWYKERAYNLEDKKHDNSDFKQALDRSIEVDKLPVGVFFKQEKPTYMEQLDISPNINAVEQKIEYVQKDLLKEFA